MEYSPEQEEHELHEEEGSPEQMNSEDLAINPEDDMETLNEKLRLSKMARKRAAEDAKLLKNRINLLMNEE